MIETSLRGRGKFKFEEIPEGKSRATEEMTISLMIERLRIGGKLLHNIYLLIHDSFQKTNTIPPAYIKTNRRKERKGAKLR